MLFSQTITSKNKTLHGLSKLSRTQVPARAIMVSAAVIAIAVLLNMFLPSSVFALVSSVATISFLFVWVMIILAHLRYRKLNPKGSAFRAPLFPFADYLVLAFLAMVVVIMMFSQSTAIATITAVIWIALVYGLQRWHSRRVTPEE
jgi:AAT family amino acid transporter